MFYVTQLKIIVDELDNRFLNDFASLEQEFLKKLKNGKLDGFLKDIKIYSS